MKHADPASQSPQVTLKQDALFEKAGRIKKSLGPVIRATGDFSIGEVCSITRKNQDSLRAEVIGFDGDEAILTPYGLATGVSPFSKITQIAPRYEIGVDESLIGRVLNALAEPIDGKGPVSPKTFYPGVVSAPDPMTRPVIETPFPLGVRALDGTLTCGDGQRMGIFASAGGGKSTLMSMLVKFSDYDTCVIALIGERGREVREFVEHNLGEEGLKKAVLIIATSDRPAIEQVKAAYTATTISEYFRDQGQKVLLLMDSLTRFARAQRQIGLSAGEPPTRRGFPPSVFELLPTLVERTGRNAHGSITALYTVLVEGGDMSEPVADEVRGLLDGHIVLSGELARSGHYPAIDVLSSASRILNNITDKPHQAAISKMRGLMSKYNEIELLIKLGEYTQGSDALADEAIAKRDDINGFLRQRTDENNPFEDTLEKILRIMG